MLTAGSRFLLDARHSPVFRYSIDDTSADWTAAEAHVVSGTGPRKSTIVSVKKVVQGTKRKAGEDAAPANDGKGKQAKPSRRSKKTKH
jgi:N-acetyltransferase 10